MLTTILEFITRPVGDKLLSVDITDQHEGSTDNLMLVSSDHAAEFLCIKSFIVYTYLQTVISSLT